MILKDVLYQCGEYHEIHGSPFVSVNGVSADTRLLKPGNIFVALLGQKYNGCLFIEEAVKKGACACILPDLSFCPPKSVMFLRQEGVPFVHVENPRLLLSALIYNFMKFPPFVLAVTGTNGKTSVSHFIGQLYNKLKQDNIVIGTNGVWHKGCFVTNCLTTPDAFMLSQYLKGLVEKGLSYLAIEASSHGLSQYRLSGVPVSVAAFTNFSRDHLDYHEGEKMYFSAKSLLFSDILLPSGVAVINRDDSKSHALIDICKQRGIKVISYGYTGEDLRLLSVENSGLGQKVSFYWLGETYQYFIPLIGSFQVMNVLCAAVCVLLEGKFSPEEIFSLLPFLSGVKGRMEYIAAVPSGADIFVDYAHTPDGLEKLLSGLRPYVKNRLHIVFGCGGERDKGKRFQMGKIAHKLADVIWITDDNPRLEDAKEIRRAILEGCPNAFEEEDRKKAIEGAMEILELGDILVVAGKGHETGQFVGESFFPFSDSEVIRFKANALERELL